MPHKCIVWGIGNDYEKIVNQLQFEVAKGNIQIEALVARKQDIIESSLDGMRLISKFELRNIKFDFLIISSSVYYMEIYKEALEMGIMEEQIIKGEVMNIPLFDFGRYIRLIENNITILSDDCWGGVHLPLFVYEILFSIDKYLLEKKILCKIYSKPHLVYGTDIADGIGRGY